MSADTPATPPSAGPQTEAQTPFVGRLECVVCRKHTTELEASLRKFNNGMCACGGALRVWPPPRPSAADAGSGEPPREAQE